MPRRTTTDGVPTTLSLCAAVAFGGAPHALAAQPPSAPPAALRSAAGGTVAGTVVDSTAGRAPLAGAVVQLVQPERSAVAYTGVTDTLGAFAITGVPPGRYLAGFLHPALDALGIVAPTPAVDVREGATARVALATPSGARVAARLCPEAAGAGAVVGTVLDAEDGRPVPGARVALAWRADSVDLPADSAEDRPRLASGQTAFTADAEGVVRVCGLPSGTDLVAVVTAPGRPPAGPLRLRAPEGGLARYEFALGRGTGPAHPVAAAHDSGGRPVPVLAPVAVRGRRVAAPAVRDRTGFEARRALPLGGRFVTAAEIERWHPPTITDALARLPGVRLVPRFPFGNTVLVRDCDKQSLVAGPTMRVLVDGVPVTPAELDYYVRPEDVQGVELYAGPALTGVAVEYTGGGACALLLVWTKRE